MRCPGRPGRGSAGIHGVLMTGRRHDGRAGPRAHDAGERAVACGGCAHQRPGGEIDHDLEVDRTTVGGREPARPLNHARQRIPRDDEQPRGGGHASKPTGLPRPGDAQLDQPLLHRGWLGQQPPRLIRQTGQHRLARLGHGANLPVTQRCCTGARPPPLGDPPSLPPGPMHDGRPRACLSCTVSGRPSEVSACGRRTPSAPSPVAARRCVRRVPTRSPLRWMCSPMSVPASRARRRCGCRRWPSLRWIPPS